MQLKNDDRAAQLLILEERKNITNALYALKKREIKNLNASLDKTDVILQQVRNYN